MQLKKLYGSGNEIMQVAGLMSGKGTNLEKVIEHGKEIEVQYGKRVYEVAVIFSDNPESNAEQIGERYNIPVIVRDMHALYRERDVPLSNLNVRTEFDEQTVAQLKPYGIDVIAYAGYNKIATSVLVNAFPGVNVHPADLSILDSEGKPKYIGNGWVPVAKAILAGEPSIRATTHRMRKELDGGEIFIRSRPLPVNLPHDFDPDNKEMVKRVSTEHQDRLKTFGDHIILPLTLEYIALGDFAEDESGMLCFDGKPAPLGIEFGV